MATFLNKMGIRHWGPLYNVRSGTKGGELNAGVNEIVVHPRELFVKLHGSSRLVVNIGAFQKFRTE